VSIVYNVIELASKLREPSTRPYDT